MGSIPMCSTTLQMIMKIIEKDGYLRRAVEVVCDNCNKRFLKAVRHIKRKPNSKHYCSSKCASEGSRDRVTLKCSNCNKEFERVPSKMKYSKSGLYFCSRECKDAAQCVGGLVEIQPPHYGTGQTKYRELAFNKYPHECTICGYNDYPKILEVHHIDNDRDNNDIDNLVILCPNCHTGVHLDILLLNPHSSVDIEQEVSTL